MLPNDNLKVKADPLLVPKPAQGRRRRFREDEKIALLSQAKGGSNISEIGRRYGISVSLLFRWKRELQFEMPAPVPRGRVSKRQEVAQEIIELRASVERLCALNAEFLRHMQSKLG